MTVENSTIDVSAQPVEPHKKLLRQPPDFQLLFKVTSFENFLKSFEEDYLHFQRVDAYNDFPGSDPFDGKQLPLDEHGNKCSKFISDPFFSASTYYDRCRSQTYSCCFSLKNSDYIWQEYGHGRDSKGKVCLVFNFGNLRTALNQAMVDSTKNHLLRYNNVPLKQLFSINYGIVEYLDKKIEQKNLSKLLNPIQYLFLKDQRYFQENELRISLSTLGFDYILKTGEKIDFPLSLKFGFNFRQAIADNVIEKILYSENSNSGLPTLLQKKLAEKKVFTKAEKC